MALRQTSAPTAEPVSLDDLKLHLRVDADDEDTHIGTLLAAARQWGEGFQGRAYVAQAWKVTLDRFPAPGEEWRADAGFVTASDTSDPGTVLVPRPPLHGVTSIQYVDLNGTTQTLSSTLYSVDTESEPGRIVPAYLQSWPGTRTQNNAVTITFTAGHATPFTAVASTNVCTATNRTMVDGTLVRLTNRDGALPAGLSEDTDYYVVSASGSAFKLSATSGGSAIDITGAGTGDHFIGEVPVTVQQAMKLLVGHWYENREAVGEVGGPVAFAVENLLWMDRSF